MPRIYTSRNDPVNYCRACFPTEKEASVKFENLGDGPDERGNCFAYDAAHPNYSGEEYKCAKCRKMLDDSDN